MLPFIAVGICMYLVIGATFLSHVSEITRKNGDTDGSRHLDNIWYVMSVVSVFFAILSAVLLLVGLF